jgi:hypothetical protein
VVDEHSAYFTLAARNLPPDAIIAAAKGVLRH